MAKIIDNNRYIRKTRFRIIDHRKMMNDYLLIKIYAMKCWVISLKWSDKNKRRLRMVIDFFVLLGVLLYNSMFIPPLFYYYLITFLLKSMYEQLLIHSKFVPIFFFKVIWFLNIRIRIIFNIVWEWSESKYYNIVVPKYYDITLGLMWHRLTDPRYVYSNIESPAARAFLTVVMAIKYFLETMERRMDRKALYCIHSVEFLRLRVSKIIKKVKIFQLIRFWVEEETKVIVVILCVMFFFLNMAMLHEMFPGGRYGGNTLNNFFDILFGSWDPYRPEARFHGFWYTIMLYIIPIFVSIIAAVVLHNFVRHTNPIIAFFYSERILSTLAVIYASLFWADEFCRQLTDWERRAYQRFVTPNVNKRMFKRIFRQLVRRRSYFYGLDIMLNYLCDPKYAHMIRLWEAGKNPRREIFRSPRKPLGFSWPYASNVHFRKKNIRTKWVKRWMGKSDLDYPYINCLNFNVVSSRYFHKKKRRKGHIREHKRLKRLFMHFKKEWKFNYSRRNYKSRRLEVNSKRVRDFIDFVTRNKYATYSIEGLKGRPVKHHEPFIRSFIKGRNEIILEYPDLFEMKYDLRKRKFHKSVEFMKTGVGTYTYKYKFKQIHFNQVLEKYDKHRLPPNSLFDEYLKTVIKPKRIRASKKLGRLFKKAVEMRKVFRERLEKRLGDKARSQFWFFKERRAKTLLDEIADEILTPVQIFDASLGKKAAYYHWLVAGPILELFPPWYRRPTNPEQSSNRQKVFYAFETSRIKEIAARRRIPKRIWSTKPEWYGPFSFTIKISPKTIFKIYHPYKWHYVPLYHSSHRSGPETGNPFGNDYKVAKARRKIMRNKPFYKVVHLERAYQKGRLQSKRWPLHRVHTYLSKLKRKFWNVFPIGSRDRAGRGEGRAADTLQFIEYLSNRYERTFQHGVKPYIYAYFIGVWDDIISYIAAFFSLYGLVKSIVELLIAYLLA